MHSQYQTTLLADKDADDKIKHGHGDPHIRYMGA